MQQTLTTLKSKQFQTKRIEKNVFLIAQQTNFIT
jgi:hypothetical protein